MNKGWTPERRAKQAAAIRRWKPWQKSTGPKSTAGKQKASQNAYKEGGWAELQRELRVLKKMMREQEEMLASSSLLRLNITTYDSHHSM